MEPLLFELTEAQLLEERKQIDSPAHRRFLAARTKLWERYRRERERLQEAHNKAEQAWKSYMAPHVETELAKLMRMPPAEFKAVDFTMPKTGTPVAEGHFQRTVNSVLDRRWNDIEEKTETRRALLRFERRRDRLKGETVHDQIQKRIYQIESELKRRANDAMRRKIRKARNDPRFRATLAILSGVRYGSVDFRCFPSKT
jgi:hypothetical protein